MKIVRIALAVPLIRCFDYLLPTDSKVVPGCRVIVPFSNKQRIGIVVDFPTHSDLPIEQLKQIIRCLEEETLFNSDMWKLLHWAANYYHAPLGEVLFSALPVKLRNGESAVEKKRVLWHITPLGQQALQNGNLQRAKKQLQALNALSDNNLEKGNNPFSSAVWSQLKQKEWVEEKECHIEHIDWQQRLQGMPLIRSERLTLNRQQALVLSLLLFRQGFTAWLLEGVTGSGKTEIYLQLIEEILKKGRQVLVLIPEIGLTPQTVQRFQARFNVIIDVLHSHLNDNQRLQVWQRARSGQSAIVIGTRSALFTPFSDLGLIVIDEEHDPSFKQQEGWRYHARDLAVVYAKQLDIPLLMGSATPSLESLHNVNEGKYRHLQLLQKAQNSTALEQHIIDLKKQKLYNGLSEILLKKIEHHLSKGNQVLLFLNRRGFAPVLLCHECGWIAECSHCDKPYTYHQQHTVLRCHHCGGQKPLPMQCGNCGSTHLITTGLGTEQLEDRLQKHFPQYRITRIDRDSTARKGQLENRLADIRQGKSQILIGTQMLAKGHHFPDVTLAALVNTDSALFSLDFRAEERLAQLYIQVAGRAGRTEKAGEVILQTHYPTHPLLQNLISGGYAAFAKQALQLRYQAGLPPFTAQILFKAQSRSNEAAERLLEQIAAYFRQWRIENNIADMQILGALPAPLSKKAGQFRWQLLLQHQSKSILQKALSDYQQQRFPNASQVRLSWDVDPQDLS